MKLRLKKAKEIIIQPAIAERRLTIAEVTIHAIVDDCVSSVIARVNINGIDQELILWEGEEYKKVGDWTQEQANARIEELV